MSRSSNIKCLYLVASSSGSSSFLASLSLRELDALSSSSVAMELYELISLRTPSSVMLISFIALNYDELRSKCSVGEAVG